MTARQFQNWAVRLSFFVVYAWFGLTKVLDVSPATPLVLDLLKVTMPFFPPQTFLVCFGVLEIVLGALFLFPRVTKLAVVATSLHLLATMLPLVLLPQHTWLSFGVLSTEGQYIMKNLLFFAALLGLWIEQQNGNPETYTLPT
jgi:uncharacterized membrane protein YkgB